MFVHRSNKAKVTWSISEGRVTFTIDDSEAKRRRLQHGPLVGWRPRWEADTTLAARFIRQANHANWWYMFIAESEELTQKKGYCRLLETLVADRELDHFAAKHSPTISPISSVSHSNFNRRNFKRPTVPANLPLIGSYTWIDSLADPNSPRLVIDYIASVAQERGKPLSFPGPLVRLDDKKWGHSMEHRSWNGIRDNHRRWSFPRDLDKLPEDSPLNGLFSEQGEWERFLETITGRVLTEYQIGEIVKKRDLKGPSPIVIPSKETSSGDHGNPEQLDPRGYVYDGPAKDVSLLRLGNKIYWIFTVGLLGRDKPVYVLDPGIYGISMRWFENFTDARSHAQCGNPAPDFRTLHTSGRRQLIRKRCQRIYGGELVWPE